MCLQLCTTLCTAQPGNYNAKKLLDNGSKLLRSAFGLDEVLLGPDCGHSDAVNVCWCTSADFVCVMLSSIKL
jgi:hypothetical protein